MFLMIPIVVGVIAMTVRWATDDSSRRIPMIGGLRVEPTSLELGEVWADKAFAWVLPVSNVEDTAVNIETIVTSCNCTSVDPKTLVILPGETKPLRLTLDLFSAFEEGDPFVLHDFSITIWPKIGGSDPMARGWVLTARVKAAMIASPSRLDFGGDLVHGGSLATRTSTITLRDRDLSVSATVDPKMASASIKRKAGSENQFELTLTPADALLGTSGGFAFDVALQVSAHDGSVIASSKLPVKGRVGTTVVAFPPQLHFGVVPRGSTVEETVTLASLDRQAFVLKQVQCSEDVVVRCAEWGEKPQANVENDRFCFYVSPRMVQPGHHQSEVRFTVQTHECAAPITIPLRVAYEGE